MKIVAISDTHNKHEQMFIPDGDIIIHAGDFSGLGRWKEIKDFIEWYGELPHKHKVLIAGNHDWGMDGTNQEGYDNFMMRRFHSTNHQVKEIESRARVLLNQYGIIYLKNSSTVVEGIKIYGSPVQPEFHGWAFNRFRGADIANEWSRIPLDTNILVTHGPAYGIKDKCLDGRRVGCEELYHKIKELKDLKLHIFGHIHEDRGVAKVFNVTYVNASSLDLYYNLQQPDQATIINYEDL